MVSFTLEVKKLLFCGTLVCHSNILFGFQKKIELQKKERNSAKRKRFYQFLLKRERCFPLFDGGNKRQEKYTIDRHKLPLSPNKLMNS